MSSQLSTVRKVQQIAQGKKGFDLFNTIELIILGLVVLFAVLFGRKMYNHFRNGGNPLNLFFSQGKDATAKAQPVNGSKQTITDAEASMRAKRLYKAMESFGTDEQTIFDVLTKDLKANDVVAIYNAFGYRRYAMGARAAFLGSEQDLIEWLRAELSTKEFNKIKPLFINAKLIKNETSN